MKKRWPRILLSLAALLVVTAVAAAAFLQHPLFGQLPEGNRLSQIQHSPNYSGGIFVNQIDTPLQTTDQSELSMLLERFQPEKGHPRPPGPTPAVKTDIKALDVKQDVVVWLGHSSYYVQLAGQRILIDPVFSENAAPIPRANLAFEGTSLYTADDFPDIDFLLISHDHYDHLDYPTIVALRNKIRHVVAGLGVGAHFERWGYPASKIHEADWYDQLSLAAGLTIHATPARHFSGRTFDRDRSLWVGYALVSSEHRLFFSGDSGYAPHFAEIGRRLGPFDWVTVDTGQYDPRWANVHMNPEQAAQAAEDLRTRVLTPGHVGRFSIAPHDWDDPFKRIAAAARGRSYALWTPEIGQPIYLDGRAQSFVAWWESNAANTQRRVATGSEEE
ncbi:MBL fold metallo-hydrolase [Thauera sp.]|uniref:MBL fold metallo-hydrolase n=1 Tax=Thauera sp. TaxID=1905334 RepID=UPI0039E3A245